MLHPRHIVHEIEATPRMVHSFTNELQIEGDYCFFAAQTRVRSKHVGVHKTQKSVAWCLCTPRGRAHICARREGECNIAVYTSRRARRASAARALCLPWARPKHHGKARSRARKVPTPRLQIRRGRRPESGLLLRCCSSKEILEQGHFFRKCSRCLTSVSDLDVYVLHR